MSDMTPLEKELLRCVEASLKQANDSTEQLSSFDAALRKLQSNFNLFESALMQNSEQRLTALEDELQKLSRALS